MRLSHSGDFGDVIYALPAVKHFGGSELFLFQAACTGYRMTPERADALIPLLVAQPYVTRAEWSDGPVGLNLDVWRAKYQAHLNLADNVAEWLGIPHGPREEPWLTADPEPAAEVVFHRCPRYRNRDFPWPRVYQRYGGRAVFVGLDEEYEAFAREVGPVPYLRTRDMLALARAIAGCRLFVGNQSAPRAVAEGLKVPVIVEVDRDCDNTHFARRRAWYGYRDDLPLPELDDLPAGRRSTIGGGGDPLRPPKEP